MTEAYMHGGAATALPPARMHLAMPMLRILLAVIVLTGGYVWATRSAGQEMERTVCELIRDCP